MKHPIIIILLLLTIAIGCNRVSLPANKSVETQDYTMSMYNYCTGRSTSSRGLQENFDSCAFLRKIVNYGIAGGLIDMAEQRFYNNFDNTEVSDRSQMYSFYFQWYDDAYDSMVRVTGDHEMIRKYANARMYEHLKDFLDVNVRIEKRMTPYLHARLVEPELLQQYYVQDSRDIRSQGGSVSRLQIDYNIENQLLNGLLSQIGHIPNKVIRYDDLMSTYTIDFSFDGRDVSDPWQALQEKVKNELGIIFVRDSAELPYIIVEVNEES